MATLPRDPDLARRMGLSSGIVREVARLAARTGGSRTVPAGHGNPWLSQQNPAYSFRTEGYGPAMIRLMENSSRSNAPVPVNSAVEELARMLLRMHPAGRLIDNALLLRELVQALNGGEGTQWQRIIDGQPTLTWPPGWVLLCDNGLTANSGAVMPWVSFMCDPGPNDPAYFPGGPVTVEAFAAANAITNGMNASTLKLEDSQTIPGDPDYYRATQVSWYEWQGGFKPAGAPGVVPESVPGVAVLPATNPAPLFGLRRQLDAARAAMLPGMGLPERNVGAKAIRASQALREALGLREEVLPMPQPASLPAPAQAPDTAFQPQVMPDVSAEFSGMWKVHPRQHAYTRDRVKTRKLKVGGAAWRIYGFFMGMFTETGDFIEAIWKALPRIDRTAGLTKTGNRRVDSMLKDIKRGWHNIDWDEVVANLAENEVEDRLIGRQQRLLNSASQTSGQGFGTQANKWHQDVYGGLADWTSFPAGMVHDAVLAAMRRLRAEDRRRWPTAGGAPIGAGQVVFPGAARIR